MSNTLKVIRRLSITFLKGNQYIQDIYRYKYTQMQPILKEETMQFTQDNHDHLQDKLYRDLDLIAYYRYSSW